MKNKVKWKVKRLIGCHEKKSIESILNHLGPGTFIGPNDLVIVSLEFKVRDSIFTIHLPTACTLGTFLPVKS